MLLRKPRKRYNHFVMVMVETTQPVPLTTWEDGSIRLTGSRVTLDSIVYQFQQGASAEEIAENFGPVSLRDVYAAISYYLAHREEVEEYLHRREAAGDAAQDRFESKLDSQATKAAMRERLLARWAARQEEK